MNAWADLVAAAVQGTARREPDLNAAFALAGLEAPSADADLPARTLDAAALLTAARRAGAPIAATALDPTRALIEPALPETAPVRSDLAQWVLMLGSHDRHLLGELLLGMAQRGLIVPAWLTPTLLELAIRPQESAAVRAAAVAVCGQRGRWLATQDERRRRLAAGQAADAPSPEDADTDLADDQPWREGDVATRLAWLSALARARPAQALQVAAAALRGKGESADLRERVIGVLGAQPLPGDPDLLDAALDDRALGVRRAAARVLGARSDTPFQDRMAARARAWVSVIQTPGGILRRGSRSLHIDPPASLDAAAARDQLATEWQGFGTVRGDRAQYLHAVVAATPLARWADLGSPKDLLQLPGTDAWLPVLHQGWARRTVTEADPQWADALLIAAPALPSTESLLAVASQEGRRAATLSRLADASPEQLSRWLAALPHPWPPDVLSAFARVLPRAAAKHPYGWSPVLTDLARLEPPEVAAILTPVIAQLPSVTSAAAQRAVDTLRLRAQLRAALDGPLDPTIQGDAP